MNVSTPGRPVPVFLDESSYSSRKRTPFRAHHTPRSPAKSCPPVSRIFRGPHLVNGGPHFVSFKSEKENGERQMDCAPPARHVLTARCTCC